MTDVLISVICPFYNAAKYLDECINSVLNQKNDSWELILVNDGSTDFSVHIAESYSKKDSRIKLYTIKNSGTLFARNYGIQQATGKYITFLDSDDSLDDNAFSALCSEIDNNIDAIVFNLCVFGTNEIKKKQLGSFDCRKIISGNNNVIDELFVKTNFGYGLCGCIFQRELFSFVNTIDCRRMRYSEDMLVAYNVFKQVNSILFLPDFLYNYRMNSNSVTHNLTPNDYFDRFQVFSTVYNDIDSHYFKSNYINPHIFWGFFNYVTFAPKYEKYNEYKRKCLNILNDDFYKNHIKKLRYERKKVRLVKSLFNLKLFWLSYILNK